MVSLPCYWVVAFRSGTLSESTPEDLRSWEACPSVFQMGEKVISTIRQLWSEDRGQDVAEYAVMLAVILVIVIGTVRLIGGNANNVFSQVSSTMSQ